MNGRQLRAARALLDWSTERLAQEADVAPRTIMRFEQGRDVKVSTLTKLTAAMAPRVEFIGDRGLALRETSEEDRP